LKSRIEFITFHQNYSYEDFIQGLRPDTKNKKGQLLFKKSNGIFKKIAHRATKRLKRSTKMFKEKIIDFEQIKSKYEFNEAIELLKI